MRTWNRPPAGAVLTKSLEGQHPALRELQEQLLKLVVTKRENTGVGFYLDFGLPADVTPAASLPERLLIDDVEASIEGLKLGAGFIL